MSFLSQPHLHIHSISAGPLPTANGGLPRDVLLDVLWVSFIRAQEQVHLMHYDSAKACCPRRLRRIFSFFHCCPEWSPPLPPLCLGMLPLCRPGFHCLQGSGQGALFWWVAQPPTPTKLSGIACVPTSKWALWLNLYSIVLWDVKSNALFYSGDDIIASYLPSDSGLWSSLLTCLLICALRCLGSSRSEMCWCLETPTVHTSCLIAKVISVLAAY